MYSRTGKRRESCVSVSTLIPISLVRAHQPTDGVQVEGLDAATPCPTPAVPLNARVLINVWQLDVIVAILDAHVVIVLPVMVRQFLAIRVKRVVPCIDGHQCLIRPSYCAF